MISLIIPIYKIHQHHKNFLNTLYGKARKSSLDFEVLFLINQFDKNGLKEMDLILNENKGIKTKIAMTTRRIDLNRGIYELLATATKEFALVLDIEAEFQKNMFNDLEKIFNKKPEVDLIEFDINKKNNYINLQQRLNLKANKIFQVEEYPRIIAYTLPILLNKIFSVKLAIEVFSSSPIEENFTIYGFEFLYKIMLKAKTFMFVNAIIANLKIKNDSLLTLSSVTKSWNNLKNSSCINCTYQQELDYAKIFYLQVCLYELYNKKGLLEKITSGNLHSEKLLQMIFKIREGKMENFDNANKYMLTNLPETKLMTYEALSKQQIKKNKATQKWNKKIK